MTAPLKVPRWGTQWLLPVAGTLVIAFWLTPYLTHPMGQDHGIFAWIGDVIRSGGMPYRDAWDIKGPAVYLVFVLIRDPLALRLTDATLMAIGALVTFRVSRRVAPPGWAWVGPVVWLVWYATLNYENTAQPDGWAAVALVGVVAMGASERISTTTRAATQSLLIGSLCLIKPTYAACGLMVLPTILGSPESDRRRLRAAAAALATGLVPIVGAGLWLTEGGAWDSYVEVLRYTASTYAGPGDRGVIPALTRLVVELRGSLILALGLGLAVLGLGWLFWQRHPFRWHGLTWMLSCLLVLMAGGKFFPYHWLPLYPAIAVLATSGVEGILRPIRDRVRPLRAWAASLAGLALLAGVPAGRALKGAAGWWMATGDPAVKARFQREWYGDDSPNGPLSKIATYLTEHSGSNDAVQLFAQDAVVYHLSERFPPTRFGTSQPVLSGGDSEFLIAYRAEFLRGLSERPPRYVVARAGASCATAATRGLLDCLEAWPEFATWVRSRYSVETAIGPYEVYRLATLDR